MRAELEDEFPGCKVDAAPGVPRCGAFEVVGGNGRTYFSKIACNKFPAAGIFKRIVNGVDQVQQNASLHGGQSFSPFQRQNFGGMRSVDMEVTKRYGKYQSSPASRNVSPHSMSRTSPHSMSRPLSPRSRPMSASMERPTQSGFASPMRPQSAGPSTKASGLWAKLQRSVNPSGAPLESAGLAEITRAWLADGTFAERYAKQQAKQRRVCKMRWKTRNDDYKDLKTANAPTEKSLHMARMKDARKTLEPRGAHERSNAGMTFTSNPCMRICILTPLILVQYAWESLVMCR